MRAKNIVDLLTLSLGLYKLSKDEEFLKEAMELTAEAKQRASDMLDTVSGKNTEEIVAQLLEESGRLKAELLEKVHEVMLQVYNRIHIANTDELKKLTDELEKVKTELALAESRIVHLETRMS